jgi:hypothetical protein
MHLNRLAPGSGPTVQPTGPFGLSRLRADHLVLQRHPSHAEADLRERGSFQMTRSLYRRPNI